MKSESLNSLIRSGTGHIHLIGIGGFGMAGLAILLRDRGFKVTGCDLLESRFTRTLQSSGIEVSIGHDISHIGSALAGVVRSTAVPSSNTEVRAAGDCGVPVYRRGEVLAGMIKGRSSVAVSGTHGKTTTSAMIAQTLCNAGLAPDYYVGGESDVLGGIAARGRGNLIVLEADESDGTLSLYEPDISVVTGIDYDHMEHFYNEEDFIESFVRFTKQTRDCVYYCGDDPVAERVCSPSGITYGLSPENVYHARDLMEKARTSSFSLYRGEMRVGEIHLSVSGRHNVLNALAACAVCHDLGLSVEAISEGLARFEPVRRRFERIGTCGGVEVYSDYAHHPAEIRAVIDSARRLNARRVIAVFQPHRYTRTLALGSDFPPAFDGVDELILLPVYAASESPIKGGTSEDLFRHFIEYGYESVKLTSSLEEARVEAGKRINEGDLLLVIGAGDVDLIADWVVDDQIGGPAS